MDSGFARAPRADTGWPANGTVAAEPLMGTLRARTGNAFDLPTEAQWEYAGRAGTTTALNSGMNLTYASECPNMNEVGRYYYNGGSGWTGAGDASVATAKVGSYRPNAWGLYDMHGNVWEWCLDWYAVYLYPDGAVTDPKGPSSSAMGRVYRGGSWHTHADACRIANRNYQGAAFRTTDLGFRAAVPLDQ